MPDKKLTDKEIVKALRSWLEEIRKSRQAYLEKVNEEHYPSMQYEYLLSDTVHAINRLQSERNKYRRKAQNQHEELKNLNKVRNCLQAENERLNKEVDRLSQVVLYNDGVTEMKAEEAKAEAYKEFAEKVHE